MGCALDEELIDKARDFHGHWCPGLAIGIRAGEWVRQNLGTSADEEIVAVVETDACGVDAIQVLTGCTFGKGNLIYSDQGKQAYSFYRRGDGKSARLVLDNQKLGGGPDDQIAALFQKSAQGTISAEEQQVLNDFKEGWAKTIMEAELDDVFVIKQAGPMPKKARIMKSIVCAECGEATMETRTRNMHGQTFCQACFAQRESRM